MKPALYPSVITLLGISLLPGGHSTLARCVTVEHQEFLGALESVHESLHRYDSRFLPTSNGHLA